MKMRARTHGKNSSQSRDHSQRQSLVCAVCWVANGFVIVQRLYSELPIDMLLIWLNASSRGLLEFSENCELSRETIRRFEFLTILVLKQSQK